MTSEALESSTPTPPLVSVPTIVSTASQSSPTMTISSSPIGFAIPEQSSNFSSVDRTTLDNSVAAIYALLDQLESQQEVVNNYALIQDAIHLQIIRGDQLETEIQNLHAAARPYLEYMCLPLRFAAVPIHRPAPSECRICDSSGETSGPIGAEFSALPPTTISRREWIPGYRERVIRSSSQFAPWSAKRIRLTSVAELDADHLYRHFVKPKGYLSPIQVGPVHAPPDGEWSPHLITSAQITAFYAQKPWEILRTLVSPVSFQLAGWLQELAKVYQDFEDRHLQALWESSHVLAITSQQRQDELDLANFCQQRKQRRSRSGTCWKVVLKFILQGIVDGHCDLDILLDPFFLHFPRLVEKRTWYPGFGSQLSDVPNFGNCCVSTECCRTLANAISFHNRRSSRIVDLPSSR